MDNTTRQFIDLHIHSNCSDGAYSPAELVAMAHQASLAAIAIADHDSVAGIAEAMAHGSVAGLEIIPAVELSVQFGSWTDIHLLGYGIDHTDRCFLEKLNAFRERRDHRNAEILDLVNEKLIEEQRETILIEDVLATARDAIGRPHIARVLLAHGYVSSIEDAFRRYLVPCNVPKYYWPLDNAIAEIKRIGGVAILAHPVTITDDLQDLQGIIEHMQELGLDGIEVFNNISQLDEMERLRRFAEKRGLLVSGGSDFHGLEEGLELGRGRNGIRFGTHLLAPLKKLIKQRQKQ